jgi:hypothetical protein
VCEDGRPLQEVWMVLEFCNRGTLSDAIQRGWLLSGAHGCCWAVVGHVSTGPVSCRRLSQTAATLVSHRSGHPRNGSLAAMKPALLLPVATRAGLLCPLLLCHTHQLTLTHSLSPTPTVQDGAPLKGQVNKLKALSTAREVSGAMEYLHSQVRIVFSAVSWRVSRSLRHCCTVHV